MPSAKLESLISEIDGWLEPGEQLIEFTIGAHPGAPLGIVLALTNKYLRLGSVGGGRNIPLDEIEYLNWSGIWARLTIGTLVPKKRLSFSINGKDWKGRAAKIAVAWARSGGQGADKP